MNELERETILAERVRKLISEKERAFIKQKSEMNNSILVEESKMLWKKLNYAGAK